MVRVLVVVGVTASREVLVVVFGGVKSVTGCVPDKDEGVGEVVGGLEWAVEKVLVFVGWLAVVLGG